MSLRRSVSLGLCAGGLAVGGLALAHGLAEARQNKVVVVKFLLGYFDAANRFVPTAGRGATNVDRNAIAMFVFSGPIEMGQNVRASLPLTVAEQAELEAAQALDPNYDPSANGYEPGVTPRKKSTDRNAFYVATGTVNATTVSIASTQAGGNQVQAAGQFFKVLKGKGSATVANRLLFNPRYAAATFNLPSQIDYNPTGLDASTRYEVSIDGGDHPQNPLELVRNLSGEPLGVPFVTSFTTTNRYAQDFTRPQIRSTSPTDGTANVTSDADVEIAFSEPMDVSSFVPPRFQGDDAWTVNVRYTSNPINGTFQGRNLLIQPRVKPQTGGDVIQIRPVQGFGKGPFEIETIVRTGVTDLSANNIIRQIQFTFKTVYDAAADQAGFVEEKFDTATKRDPNFGPATSNPPSGDNTLATWNGAAAPGFLKGVVTDTPFVVSSPLQVANQGVNYFGSVAIRFQNMHTTKDMGGRARTITGGSWRPTTFFSNRTYPNFSLLLGHANDLVAATGFPGNSTASPGPSSNYYRDTPVAVVPSTTYPTAGLLANNYVPFPKFAQNFNSSGTSPVILEIAHGGNGVAEDRWQCDANFGLNASVFTSFSAPPVTQTWNWYFDTKFTFVTPGAEAQSLFYDVARDDARMLPQQIVPTTQPQGTSVTFVWQGAKSDPAASGAPDLGTLTPWLADVRQLSTYRYIRFRATLLNNVTTRTAPALDSILLPFTYK